MTASVTPVAGMKCARCPRCGRSFDCGRNTQPFDCWCSTLPAVPASKLDPRGRCLCPECLAEAAAPGPDDATGSGGLVRRARDGA